MSSWFYIAAGVLAVCGLGWLMRRMGCRIVEGYAEFADQFNAATPEEPTVGNSAHHCQSVVIQDSFADCSGLLEESHSELHAESALHAEAEYYVNLMQPPPTSVDVARPRLFVPSTSADLDARPGPISAEVERWREALRLHTNGNPQAAYTYWSSRPNAEDNRAA